MTSTRRNRPPRAATGLTLLALLLGGVASAKPDGVAQAPVPATQPATVTSPDEETVPAKLPRRAEEVVVQAVRADVDTPITKTDVPREEIEAKNVGQEIPFLLSEVPSITQYSDTGLGAGYSYLQMRGIGATRINFSLDGAPLNEAEDSTLYFVNFADLAGSLDSIQVQRGVGTSTFGSAAFAGSVNFASLPLTDGFETTARLTAGSFGTFRTSVGVQTGLLGSSGWKLAVRGAYQDSDGFRESSGVDQKSLLAAISHESEESFFKLLAVTGRERTQLAFYAVEPEVLERDLRFNPMSPEEKDDFSQTFLTAQYTRFLSPGTSVGGQLYANMADGWYRLFSDASRTMLWQYGLDWRNLGGSVNLKTSSGPLGLIWGAQGSDFSSEHVRDVVGGGRDYLNNGSKSEANTFAKLTWDSGPWHAYGDAQLRWARFGFEGDLPLGSVSWTFFNPKVGVRRDLAKDLTAYASIGRTTREPARADMLGGQDNPTIPYDLSAVRPEKVTAVELGTEWRGRKVTALVSLYAMEFRDEIALTGELSEIGLPLRRNVEKSSRRGIEWDVTWRPVSSLTARFTGNLNRSRISEWTQFYDVYDADFAWTGSTSRTYADVRPLLTPPFVGNLSIDWSPVNPVTVGATGRWVNRAYLDNTNVESLSAPSFFRLDASLALDLAGVVATGKPRLRVRVDNVLDERRSYPNGYSYLYAVEDGAGGESLAGTPYFFPLATRNVSVSLDLSF